MRTVFLGTTDFAAAILDRVAASPHRPQLVVTPPDRPRGRGRRLASPPVAERARELGIELWQTPDASATHSLERIPAAEPTLGVVSAFGQLIREPLLSDLELLNVHPSLLPRWRGAAPIERAIMAGDSETGVSIMRVTAGLDSGPVALRQPVAIAGRNYGELSAELAAVGGELILRALELRAAGQLELCEQSEAGASYAERIDAAERRLDPILPAEQLERIVRALTPHIGAYLMLSDGERLGVRRAAAERGDLGPGSLDYSDGLRLGCATGILRLCEVQPPGGRPMDAEAYLRGHRPPPVA